MRAEPPDSDHELQALTGFLDWQRESILLKTDGLTREQLAQPLPPSLSSPRSCGPGTARRATAAARSWRTPTASTSCPWARRQATQWDLRWVLIHMIEETARHAGHADLLREAIDGTVGE